MGVFIWKSTEVTGEILNLRQKLFNLERMALAYEQMQDWLLDPIDNIMKADFAQNLHDSFNVDEDELKENLAKAMRLDILKITVAKHYKGIDTPSTTDVDNVTDADIKAWLERHRNQVNEDKQMLDEDACRAYQDTITAKFSALKEDIKAGLQRLHALCPAPNTKPGKNQLAEREQRRIIENLNDPAMPMMDNFARADSAKPEVLVEPKTLPDLLKNVQAIYDDVVAKQQQAIGAVDSTRNLAHTAHVALTERDRAAGEEHLANSSYTKIMEEQVEPLLARLERANACLAVLSGATDALPAQYKYQHDAAAMMSLTPADITAFKTDRETLNEYEASFYKRIQVLQSYYADLVDTFHQLKTQREACKTFADWQQYITALKAAESGLASGLQKLQEKTLDFAAEFNHLTRHKTLDGNNHHLHTTVHKIINWFLESSWGCVHAIGEWLQKKYNESAAKAAVGKVTDAVGDAVGTVVDGARRAGELVTAAAALSDNKLFKGTVSVATQATTTARDVATAATDAAGKVASKAKVIAEATPQFLRDQACEKGGCGKLTRQYVTKVTQAKGELVAATAALRSLESEVKEQILKVEEKKIRAEASRRELVEIGKKAQMRRQQRG